MTTDFKKLKSTEHEGVKFTIHKLAIVSNFGGERRVGFVMDEKQAIESYERMKSEWRSEEGLYILTSEGDHMKVYAGRLQYA